MLGNIGISLVGGCWTWQNLSCVERWQSCIYIDEYILMEYAVFRHVCIVDFDVTPAGMVHPRGRTLADLTPYSCISPN